MPGWPYTTKTWKRLRIAKLSTAPLCEMCLKRGRDVIAEAVDHVVAIAKGGEPFPALEGLMSLCWSCHSSKTANVDRTGGTGIAMKGAGLDGLPLDPAHPFFGGGASSSPERAEPETDPTPTNVVSWESGRAGGGDG